MNINISKAYVPVIQQMKVLTPNLDQFRHSVISEN